MLVNCVVYESGKKLAEITVPEISDYLVRPGAFVWVALRDATEVSCAFWCVTTQGSMQKSNLLAQSTPVKE